MDSDISGMERELLSGNIGLVHRYYAHLLRCGADGLDAKTNFLINLEMEEPHRLSLLVNGRTANPCGVSPSAILETTLEGTNYRIIRGYTFSPKTGWRAKGTRYDCLSSPQHPLTESDLRHYKYLMSKPVLAWLRENGQTIHECQIRWGNREAARANRVYLAALKRIQKVEKELYDAVMKTAQIRGAAYRLGT